MTEKRDLFGFQILFDNVKYSELKFGTKNEVSKRVKDIASFAEQISSKHHSCIQITKDIARLQQDTPSLVHKYEVIKKQLEQKEKAKYSLERIKSLKLTLNDLYEQYLGYEIKAIEGGPNANQHLLFSFKYIRKTNPDKCYSFVLVLQDNIYKVADCVPPLKELDELLEELNKTDDLKSFVVKVRQKFSALSSSKEPMNDCTNIP